jgi:POT family proton-dependent oligopeptide transporter
MTIDCPARQPPGDFLGHPRGLAVLFGSELWERFSYYGMRALLVLYMVDHLFAPGRAAGVIGLDSLRRALEWISGPLGAQPFASQIYGLYTGLVYLTPILGGLLADRALGRATTVAIGAGLMVAGHFLMAVESCFLPALLLIAFGCGAFKPNISTQVGELYAPGDARRDRAYSIFYVGINIGAFLAPLVCGSLGEALGWHYGFVAAGAGMAAGAAIYLLGRRALPAEPRTMAARAAAPPEARRAFLGVALLFLPSALFWSAFEQQGNTLALFAAHAVDRGIDLYFWRGEIPVTWVQALNPLMIFLLTPPLVAHWTRLAARGREPSTLRKLTFGTLGVAAAYGLLAVAAVSGEKASWLWVLLFSVVVTLAELHFSPITLSLVSRLAPPGARSAVMGAWFASMFAGNLFAGWLGGYWSRLPAPHFFLMIAGLGVLAAIVVEAARPLLRPIVEPAISTGR